jgi:allantoin racemase
VAHIRYIVPGPMSKTRLGAAELGRRHELLSRWASPDTTVTICDTPTGPASIESAYEEYLCIPALASAFEGAEQDGVDAAIVGCFDDPGVDALRELATRTAAVGPAMASIHLAAILGTAIGIVSVPEPGALRRLIAANGMKDHVTEIAVIESSVLGLRDDLAATTARIHSAASDLVRRGADVIVLGCMSMAFLEIDRQLEDAIGVPVVNPARAALGIAEMFARCRLLPSKRAYPMPPKMVTGTPLAELVL